MLNRVPLLLVTFIAMLFATAVVASPSRGEAPFLTSADGSVERIPLTMTAVDVTIAGVIADVTVRQTYENRGDHPIEAVYVFPGSSRAAIHALTMRIGNRVIRADIREKEQARREYAEARAAGKTASLLEQLDPSVFRMSVANVLPGDRIEVELAYTELLVPTKGEYAFFFPNTLGHGNYSADAAAAPTSTSSDVADYAFDIRTRLIGALPITQVESPSHAVDVAFSGPFDASVTLAEDALRAASTSDYEVRFRYAGDRIATGVLAYPHGDGGYFLLLAEPPRAIEPTLIAPREFIFVVDISGSMHGRPLEISKDLMGDLMGSLRPSDVFNVILFEGKLQMLSETGSITADTSSLARARKLMDSTSAGGSTDIIGALERAYELPRIPGRARSIVIVTDGVINAGGDAFQLIRSHLGEANAFVFGIGPYVERPVIERLARAGAGEPFIVDELGRGAEVAQQLRDYIDRPLWTQITVAPDGLTLDALEPGRIPDLLAERPVVLVGRYQGDAPGTVTLSGHAGGRPYKQQLRVDPQEASPELSGLRQLWARERIQRLIDEQAGSMWRRGSSERAIPDHTAEITALGLEYSLLTPYTSFVAIDETVRSAEQPVRVDQPAIGKAGEYEVAPMAMAAAPPAPRSPPVASVYAYQSGIGHALPHRILLTPPERPTTQRESATPTRSVAGRLFTLRDDVWSDLGFGEQTVLRVRRDGPAWLQLLALRPQLAEWAAMGDRVLVAFDRFAILISDDGFSDYPAELLVRAVAERN
jgi:Ca-activated chloride channel homolog